MRQPLVARSTNHATFTLLCVWGLLGTACASRVAEPLDPTTVTWTTYTDDELGFSLRHPAGWTPHRRRRRGGLAGQSLLRS